MKERMQLPPAKSNPDVCLQIEQLSELGSLKKTVIIEMWPCSFSSTPRA